MLEPTDLMDPEARALAAKLGHTFADESLLDVALTHRSAAFEANANKRGRRPADNERMEFLGDVVLGLAVSEMLWRRFPTASEGELTRMRASIVNETNLARIALEIGVGEAIKLGRGEDNTGGRTKPSLLADSMEAVFAAVYLDGGIDRAREVIVALIGGFSEAAPVTSVRDEKTRLQEWMQEHHKITPRYEVIGAVGPDHDRTYEVEMQAGDVLKSQGSGRSKKSAEQDAARKAMELLAAEEKPEEKATEKPEEKPEESAGEKGE